MAMNQQFLSDVNPENYFYVCNGSVLKNLHDLHILLENVDDGVFSYHANESKNDFLNWIRDVIQDDLLTKKIEKCKTRDETLACVKKRINSFKNKRNVSKGVSIGNKKPFKSVRANPRERKSIISQLKRNL